MQIDEYVIVAAAVSAVVSYLVFLAMRWLERR
jgi:hypothetical protein